MFERWGEQYSKLTNNLDLNTIIHKSRNVVKTADEKSAEKFVQLSMILDTCPQKISC